MSEKIDMSLDDIIKQNKGQYRQPRQGNGRSANRMSGRLNFTRNRQQRRNSRPSPYSRSTEIPDKWQHDLFDGGSQTQRSSRIGHARDVTKLLISNLNYSVSDTDIKELFAEFGPLTKAAVRYDKSGRSLGTADVIFESHEDALKAMKQYNKVPLDGLPMSIMIASSTSPLSGPRNTRTRNFQNYRGQGSTSNNRDRGFRGNRSKKQPTAEELDAELDAYVKKIE